MGRGATSAPDVRLAHMAQPTSVRGAINAIGGRALVTVLLAPLLTVVIVMALMPHLVATSYQASAHVELYSISGTHATYEVSSIAADFTTAYADVGERAGVAVNTGEPAPTLTARHPSDSSVVDITYAASSEQSARRGLRAAAAAAATDVAQQEAARTGIAVKAARSALEDAVAMAPTTGTKTPTSVKSAPPEIARYVRGARSSLVEEVAQQYANALLADATAKAAAQSVATLVRSTPVTVTELSSTSAQIRVVGIASVSALVVACLVLLVLRRRSPRARPGKSLAGGPVRE